MSFPFRMVQRLTFLALSLLLCSTAFAAEQKLVIGADYVCNGERLYVDGCDIHDLSDAGSCFVGHPDRPLNGGLMAYTSEIRGQVTKEIQNCTPPSGAALAHAKAAQAESDARTRQIYGTPSPKKPSLGGLAQFLPQRYEPPTDYSAVVGLVILIGVGAGAYILFYRRHQTASLSSVEYHHAENSLKNLRPASGAAPPASPVLASRPQSSATGAGTALSAKERFYAAQKDKYQTTYNDAVDELNAASAGLVQMGAVAQGVQDDLKVLSKAIQESVTALIQGQFASTEKIAVNAALLKPVVRLYKRTHGLIRLLVAGVVVYWGYLELTRLVAGQYALFLSVYLIYFMVSFFFEWRFQLKEPTFLVNRNADQFNHVSLLYCFDGQSTFVANGTPTLFGLKFVMSTQAPSQEVTIPANPAVIKGPGTYLLAIGDLAAFWPDQEGNVKFAFANPSNDFMKVYAPLMTQAVSQQKTFFANTLPVVSQYGKAIWRRRSAQEKIPELEKLVKDTDRLETLWRSTYTNDKVFSFLLPRIDLFNMLAPATPPGLLLYGYPGNGKAYLAKKIADSVSGRLVEVTASKLATPEDVKKMWEASRGKQPVVLYVDYAERVFPKPGSENQGGSSREATLEWIAQWQQFEPYQSRTWVILTAQNDQDLHPAILGQIGGSKVEITSPDATGREIILRNACQANQIPDALPKWLVAATGGASVRDLQDIVKETKLQSVPYAPEDAHWRAAVKSVRGADDDYETKTWDRLVLPPEIKDQLKRSCRILTEADRYKKVGVNVPNILLFGPPGTGKTDIARTFAHEGGVKFVAATTSDLKGQYVGQSAHLVRDLFAKARSVAPAILFIDEIETVAAKRGSGTSDQFAAEIVSEMLAQMDGAKKYDRPVFVLAATNLPEQIDQAILSRFTTKIEIPLPDENARCEMLKKLLSERAVDPSLDIDKISALLAKRTNGKSGRDLVMLINRAMERCVMEADSPDDVRLTEAVIMAEVAPQQKGPSEADLQKIWSEIVLKPEIKESILGKIRMFNSGGPAAPKGLLLYGPPGTGKTLLAKRISDSTGCKFFPLSNADLKAGFVGQSGQAVKAVFEKARSYGRCVIFVDECEGVFGRRGSVGTDSGSEEVVREFIQAWEGFSSEGQIWVVGATNQRQLLDDAVVSRFGASVEIGLPEAPERLQILQLEMKKYQAETAIPDFVGRDTTGLAGRDLSQIARDVYTTAAEKNTAIAPAMWKDVVGRYVTGGGPAVDEGARWDSLVLAEDVIDKLKTVCESLRQIEVLQKQGLQPPRGALLFGPPGTGKTQIARTLANESGLPFIAAGPSDIKAGYIGQSGQKVHELFERARSKAPCILFIDEIESCAAARGTANADQFAGEIVTQLLTELDGVKKNERHVFLLAATNHPEIVDAAILSRFVDKIEIPNPDAQQRRQLFQNMLAKKHADFDVEQVAGELAEKAGNISGRDIQSLIERASQMSLQRALRTGTADRVTLTRQDLMSQLAPQGKEVTDADLQKVWSQIVLKPEIKESILSKIRMFNAGDKAAPKGLLLYGPPGTGKTEIAKRIAESTSCFFKSVSSADLKAGYIGQSGQNVKKAWDDARAHGRCVLFVDECDAVFGRRGSVGTDSFSEEVVGEFIQSWEGVGSTGQVWVVGATNQRERLDNTIVSRFGAAVEIGLPEAPERMQILAMEMKKYGREGDVPEFVARATNGMAGRDLSQIVRDICALASEKQSVITPEIWQEVVERYSKSGSETVDEDARWDSLVLSDDTIEKLKTVCESLKQIEVLQKQGIQPPRGALLYGPPGTGKTQIARTLANESGLPFIAAGPSDIKAGYIGQSGLKVHELFERARSKAPCILFIDEIDSGAAARGTPKSDQFTNEIVTQMLTELDGVKKNPRHVFLLAATNHPELVDSAIRSRFVDKIEIPNPDTEQRRKMLQILLVKKRVDFDVDQVAAELAKSAGDISGRDIYSLIERASQSALQRALKTGKVDQVILSRQDLVSQLPTA